MERSSFVCWRHWVPGNWAPSVRAKPSPGLRFAGRERGELAVLEGLETLREVLTNGWWNSGDISSLGKFCLLETVTARTLCNTGQGKAKDIEAGCEEGDVVCVVGIKQSCLMWWDRHRGWNRSTDLDELEWKWIWDYVTVWGNPVRSLGFSKVWMKVMAGGEKQPKV